MGLLVRIYRSDYDPESNVFHGFNDIVVENIAGPFDATGTRVSANIAKGWGGEPILVPSVFPEGMIGPMFGGTFAYSSDSRFFEKVNRHGAIPIHDRFETPEQYERLSR